MICRKLESLRRLADALGVSADYLLGRVKNPVGKDIVASDPEVVVLLRRFQRMSHQAGEQVKQLFEIVDATDGKKRLRKRKKKPILRQKREEVLFILPSLSCPIGMKQLRCPVAGRQASKGFAFRRILCYS